MPCLRFVKVTRVPRPLYDQHPVVGQLLQVLKAGLTHGVLVSIYNKSRGLENGEGDRVNRTSHTSPSLLEISSSPPHHFRLSLGILQMRGRDKRAQWGGGSQFPRAGAWISVCPSTLFSTGFGTVIC